MAEERVFTVAESKAVRAERMALADAGLLERQHLQEWVKEHPDILGEDILLVAEELDKWATAAGEATWERLDLLGLDRTGRLVVAELKRHRAPDAVLVQALNYAAMASRFSLDLLAEAYGRYRGDELMPDALLNELREWAPNLSDESLSPPRIVLVAEDFGPVLTNTAMFLIERGVDLRLVRLGLYRLEGGTLALTTSQLLPVPEAEEFMVRPRSAAPTQRATRAAAARRGTITERLVAAAALTKGEELRLIVPARVQQDREAIGRWLAEEPLRATAHWRDDADKPVEWAVDGTAYTLMELVRRVVIEATGAQPQTEIWGPNWFAAPDGRTLEKLAAQLPDTG